MMCSQGSMPPGSTPDTMDFSPYDSQLLHDSLRRDTMSTISSDKQPSLPSGVWPLTIHGNCARCGHHHKAAVIQIVVAEGVCEASHVICERCNQKWLTIGGLNTTQISLLSAVTTDLDRGEIKFRQTLFSIVRSATSIASPTALANVPEDPSRVPSRSSSIRPGHRTPTGSANVQTRSLPLQSAGMVKKSLSGPDDGATTQETSTEQPPISSTIFKVKYKLKKTMDMLKNVQLKGFVRRSRKPKMEAQGEGQTSIALPPNSQELPISSHIAASASPANNSPCDRLSKTTTQAVEDLKSLDKETIRNMSPEQRHGWIREQITSFKCRCAHHCFCKRHHSTSSIGRPSSVTEQFTSPTTPTVHRFSLEQMGSQFDALPTGALFTHTGPLTISATRTSEADTAVENQTIATASTPRHSRPDFAQQAHRPRSPRPASLVYSRHSRQYLRNDRSQRDSVGSILASGPMRNSWLGMAHLSTTSLFLQTVPAEDDAPELSSSPEQVGGEEMSADTSREDVTVGQGFRNH